MWNRVAAVMLAAGSWALPVSAVTVEFDLPTWGGDVPRGYWLGGGLWPSPGPLRATPVGGGEGTEAPEDAVDLPSLDRSWEAVLSGTRPVDFLIDPQRILTEQRSNDIHRFLEFHAAESRFPIYVIVSGGDRRMPENMNLGEIRRRWFGEESSVLLAFDSHLPESLRMNWANGEGEETPVSPFPGMLESCVAKAGMPGDPSDQLERVAIELSIQLFRLEKAVSGSRGNHPVESAEPVEPPGGREDVEVMEVPPPDLLAGDGISLVDDVTGEWNAGIESSEGRKWLAIAGGGLFLLFLIGMVKALISRGLSARRGPVLFPSYRSEKRLNGEYSGGAFVSISFELGKSDGRVE